MKKKGENFSVLARAAGLNEGTVWNRVHRLGMSIDKALSIPLRGARDRAIAAKAHKAGFKLGTIKNRMKRFDCSADEAIAMGALGLGRHDAATKSRAAGLKPQTVYSRMKRFNCSADEAIAMGAPRRSYMGMEAASYKARQAGLDAHLIGARMHEFKCTADEAIAMGPPRTHKQIVALATEKRAARNPHMQWAINEAEKAGISEGVVRQRLNSIFRMRGDWTVEKAITLPLGTHTVPGSGMTGKHQSPEWRAKARERMIGNHYARGKLGLSQSSGAIRERTRRQQQKERGEPRKR